MEIEWISADERMPEKNDVVIVVIQFKEYQTGKVKNCSTVARYTIDEWIPQHDEDEYQRLDENSFDYIGAVVTHWMPLPEPPK